MAKPGSSRYTYNPETRDCVKFVEGEYTSYTACVQANYPYDCFDATGCRQGPGGRFMSLDECTRHADCQSGYQYDPSVSTPTPCKYVGAGVNSGPKHSTMEACFDASPGYVCDSWYTKNPEGCRYVIGPSPRAPGLPKYKRVEDCKCWGAGGMNYWGYGVPDKTCSNVYSGLATSLALPMDSMMLFRTKEECDAKWNSVVAPLQYENNLNPYRFQDKQMFKCAGDDMTAWMYYARPGVRRGFSARPVWDSWGGENRTMVKPVDCTYLPQGPIMTPNLNGLPSDTCTGLNHQGCGPLARDTRYNCCDPTRFQCSASDIPCE